MSEKTNGKSIVPSWKTDLIASGAGGNRLIRRAASDALVPMQTMMSQPATTLHRVGTREFHDEDFQQLKIWASELGWDEQLSNFITAIDREIMELIFNRDRLVFNYFAENNSAQWTKDGRVRIFVKAGEGNLSFPRLPKLTHLGWFNQSLPNKLDLSSVPALTHLDCADNQLTELDLSSVPDLTGLWCNNNQLTELDLSSVPELALLGCYNNQLTELDLSSVPALKLLWCANNQLTELDLSSVPALTHLGCENNQLTELDLASVPALEFLYSDNNQLTKLDIRGCLHLRSVTVDPWVIVHKRPDQTVVHPE